MTKEQALRPQHLFAKISLCFLSIFTLRHPYGPAFLVPHCVVWGGLLLLVMMMMMIPPTMGGTVISGHGTIQYIYIL